MAEETKKEAPAPTPEQVLRDQVEGLKKMNELLSLQIGEADVVIKAAQKAQKDAEHRADKAERKLKDAKTATPQEGVVVLDGKPWKIEGTVHAKFALEEVKRGHIHEDVVLVITNKPA